MEVAITYLTGEMKLQEPIYWIEQQANGYHLRSEFISVGPFNSQEEIRLAAHAAGMKVNRGLGQ